MKKKIYIALVIDTSESLEKKGDIINNALKEMITAIKTGPELWGCDIYFTLVTFTNNMYHDIVCCPINKVDESTLTLRFRGQTNPAPALRFAIGDAIAKTQDWALHSEECFYPLVFFMTDGVPYPKEYDDDYMNAVKEFRSNIYNSQKKKNVCTVIGAGYGDADMDKIRMLAGDFTVRIKDNDSSLAAFFKEIVPKTIVEFSTNGIDALTRNFDRNISGIV